MLRPRGITKSGAGALKITCVFLLFCFAATLTLLYFLHRNISTIRMINERLIDNLPEIAFRKSSVLTHPWLVQNHSICKQDHHLREHCELPDPDECTAMKKSFVSTCINLYHTSRRNAVCLLCASVTRDLPSSGVVLCMLTTFRNTSSAFQVR